MPSQPKARQTTQPKLQAHLSSRFMPLTLRLRLRPTNTARLSHRVLLSSLVTELHVLVDLAQDNPHRLIIQANMCSLWSASTTPSSSPLNMCPLTSAQHPLSHIPDQHYGRRYTCHRTKLAMQTQNPGKNLSRPCHLHKPKLLEDPMKTQPSDHTEWVGPTSSDSGFRPIPEDPGIRISQAHSQISQIQAQDQPQFHVSLCRLEV